MQSSFWESRMRRREAIEGYLWISPWVIGFVVFSLGPIVASAYLSFTKYKIGGQAEWIGLANYNEAFFNDRLFWPSLGRTAYFSLAAVFIGVFLSLLAAVLLNQALHGRSTLSRILLSAFVDARGSHGNPVAVAAATSAGSGELCPFPGWYRRPRLAYQPPMGHSLHGPDHAVGQRRRRAHDHLSGRISRACRRSSTSLLTLMARAQSVASAISRCP